MAGLLLVVAAVLFWISWLLMPGVGVTDAAQIFELVGSHRPLVAISVVAQLVSAILYVPALAGALSDADLRGVRGVRWGAGLLLVGAMGSAADAVLHLLAFAMTAPGVDRASMVPVMAFMQGQGLMLLAPLILSFFVGGAALSWALAKAGLVSRWNPWMHGLAVGVAVLGGVMAASGLVPARVVGLAFLGVVSGAHVWAGIALSRRPAAVNG